MPKSRRDKVVALTNTKKRSYDTKKDLVSEIQACCDKYAHVFVLDVHNQRNNLIKDVREAWKHSRLFMGRNKVMALGLGKTVESEHKPKLHSMSAALKGQRGLLFTNQSVEEVKEWFANHRSRSFARSGLKATETVVIPAGPLDMPHSMEPHLRTLGLPTSLKNGIVTMDGEHTVCTEGKTLNTQQATILKHLGNCMAEFQMELIAHWHNEVFTMLSDKEAAPMDADEEAVEDAEEKEE